VAEVLRKPYDLSTKKHAIWCKYLGLA